MIAPGRAPEPRRARERGVALIIVLWALALLALIGTRVAASGRVDAGSARALLDRATLEAACDGAIQSALYDLVTGSRTADGRARPITVAGVAVQVAIADETGRLNPSLAPTGLTQSLLLTLGVPADRAATLAAAITDWRTPGDGKTKGGAKSAEYRAANLPYGPRDAPFRSVDELGLVLGMTPRILALLAPHLSVFNDSDVNREAADDDVAAALIRFGRNVLPPGLPAGNAARLAHVTASARLADGARFSRDAVIRISTEGDPADPLYAVLDEGSGR